MIIPVTKNVLVDAWLTLAGVPLLFNLIAYGITRLKLTKK